MSLVGPRALPSEIEKKILKKNKFLRRSIRPGMTELSQINYRGRKRSLKNKVKLDMEYVVNRSIYSYFNILLKTIFVIIKRYKGNNKGYSL
jgi:lipopolysaccharide/colanic/teichoic acid biosynthesis glycosyltransferase